MTPSCRTILFAALTLILLSAQTRAQVPPTPLSATDENQTVGEDFNRRTYYAAGLNVGLLSGSGLAGRIVFPKGYGIQLSTFAITALGYFHFNVGLEGQYAFTSSNDGRFYGLLGMGYYSSTAQDTIKNGSGNRVANPYRVGLGLGYDIFVSRNFTIALSAGIITFFPNTTEVFPIPQLGLYYYFR